jgi:predicted secreted Zn-dependent protease
MGQAARRFGLAAAILAAMTLAASAADVTVKSTYYSISGKTGLELLNEMNRKGPRHGFLTKAIAQTQIRTDLKGDLVHANGVCRASGARLVMQITYVYPRPANRLDPALARRWKAFQATNVSHEEAHGRVAKKMVADVNRMLRSFRMADKPSCSRAGAKVASDLGRILAAAAKSQEEFDRREHRDGGPVEKSILALVGKV